MSAEAVREKGELFVLGGRGLGRLGHGGETRVRVFFVPGRIEVLGKHTDYAGGRSIVAAVEKGFCIVAVRRQDDIVRVFDAAGGEQIEFRIGGEFWGKVGHWSNYAWAVVKRLGENFSGGLRGADIVFVSDLPAAAGMSSSSAMIVGFFLVLSAFNELADRQEYRANIRSVEDLAGYLGTVENGQSFGSLAGDKGVGTFGGSEDHTAILCCGAGRVSQYCYCPVRFERSIDLPGGYVFAVASSGIVAEKTGAAKDKYNRISALSRCATEVWNEASGRADAHLGEALGNGCDAAARIREVLRDSNDGRFRPEELLGRFEHFFIESEQIVPAAGDALCSGDMGRFGEEVVKSQEMAERLLGNQVPETIFLARSARELGAFAASAFGAGFGGSVWALTEIDKGEEFVRSWSASYGERFTEAGERAVFLLTRPGPAVLESGGVPYYPV